MADNKELTKGDFIILEYSMRELDSTSIRHANYLDEFIRAVENLTQAIIQLLF
jgi:hypothetical protein